MPPKKLNILTSFYFSIISKKKQRKHVVDMVNDVFSLALYRKSVGWPWPDQVNDDPLDRPQKVTYNEKKRLTNLISPHCGFVVRDLSVVHSVWYFFTYFSN